MCYEQRMRDNHLVAEPSMFIMSNFVSLLSNAMPTSAKAISPSRQELEVVSEFQADAYCLSSIKQIYLWAMAPVLSRMTNVGGTRIC